MVRTPIVAVLSLTLLSCGRPPNVVVVGSKNFTEQVVLGEILAQHIEQRLGIPVVRKLNLGGTLLAHEALVNGSIDLYPEYTGTALTAILKQPAVRDPAAAIETVRAAYVRQWQLRWLDPLGFNNTFAMMVRGDVARAAKVTTISDAARNRAWHMGVGYEFQQRPDGLDGLLKTYGLRLENNPVTMDLGLLYQALAGGKVDMIAANSTDGLAGSMDVAILEDDRRYFPPYQCAVVVRENTLARLPKLGGILLELSGKLPDNVIRKLNFEVDGRHHPASQVAADFLRSQNK
jgi:glycine betaine/choline ABC-type transport system substrate-binding protein